MIDIYSVFKKFVSFCMYSGITDSDSLELKGRIILLNLMNVTGIAMLLPFSLLAYSEGYGVLSAISLGVAVMLGGSFVCFRIVRNFPSIRLFNLFLMFALYVYLFATGGVNNTGPLWCYTFPVFAMFFLGPRKGSLLVAIFFVTLGVFLVPIFPFVVTYSVAFKLRFMSSFAVVCVLTYYSVYMMAKIQMDICSKNRELEKTMNEWKQAEYEKKELEEQLLQVHKMEAIGQLAGGIAHDFNNMLTGISGFAALVQRNADGDPAKIRQYGENIVGIAKRASDLTAKLLAFARKGKFRRVEVDLHTTIRNVMDILTHTIDKRIILSKHYRTDHATVLGDPVQLENAILNLAVNARDALPQGGEISFATEVVYLDVDHLGRHIDEVEPGIFLKVSVTDTGIGMDSDLQKRIFEPFFTTKEQGKGTGLGLASIYGTMKTHQGFIELQSEVGRGSTFELYLPYVEKPRHVVIDRTVEESAGRGAILLVDDEQSILEMTTEILRDLGYVVTTCTDGENAVDHYMKYHKNIDLVILDLVMPRLSGHDCFLRLKEINPAVRVYMMSGFTFDYNSHDLMKEEGVLGFIQKPFDIGVFAKLVQDALRVR